MCDVSAARLSNLQLLYPDVVAEKSFERMLDSEGLDAVVVATPVKSHFSMAKAALLAGRHVLLEKPMASSSGQCEELIEIARRKGLVLMVGHTFLYSPAVRKIKEIIDQGDLGQIRYICARRLNLGLYQKDINVAWDLAPHDISIILHLLRQFPESVNCCGDTHVTAGIEDVTSMSLNFGRDCSAIIHSSWLDPRKVREITVIGSKRMLLFDDVAPLEKIRLYDMRVDRPPHYDTFAEFQYAYHYGDITSPYLKQEEPLKVECRHFLDCIRNSQSPLSGGAQGLELVRILEASSASLKLGGAPISMLHSEPAGNHEAAGIHSVTP